MDVDLDSWPQAKDERWLQRLLEDETEMKFWTGILEETRRGLIDTWDFQWLYSSWCQGGLTAVPNENLVTNVGLGSDATHTKENDGLLLRPTGRLDNLEHPNLVAADREADRSFFQQCVKPKRLDWWSALRSKFALRSRLRRALSSKSESALLS